MSTGSGTLMVTDTKSASGLEDICEKKIREMLCWKEAVCEMKCTGKQSRKAGMRG
jgi:hypothetical protein